MAASTKAIGNVFQVLCPTRNYGVGTRVTRKIWSKFPEPTYWEITRIHPSPDLKHGKVFGRFTFRGASLSLSLLLSNAISVLRVAWNTYTRVSVPVLTRIVLLYLLCASCCLSGKTDPVEKRINVPLKKDWVFAEL
jgi:hypothetical protein